MSYLSITDRYLLELQNLEYENIEKALKAKTQQGDILKDMAEFEVLETKKERLRKKLGKETQSCTSVQQVYKTMGDKGGYLTVEILGYPIEVEYARGNIVEVRSGEKDITQIAYAILDREMESIRGIECVKIKGKLYLTVLECDQLEEILTVQEPVSGIYRVLNAMEMEADEEMRQRLGSYIHFCVEDMSIPSTVYKYNVEGVHRDTGKELADKFEYIEDCGFDVLPFYDITNTLGEIDKLIFDLKFKCDLPIIHIKVYTDKVTKRLSWGVAKETKYLTKVLGVKGVVKGYVELQVTPVNIGEQVLDTVCVTLSDILLHGLNIGGTLETFYYNDVLNVNF